MNYTNSNGTKYKSTSKHSSIAKNKKWSRWISVTIERHVFDNADNNSWLNCCGNMFGFSLDFSIVGKEKEQFGFFQAPKNKGGEWHGFPIFPFSSSRYKICATLLEKWVTQGFISQEDVPNILKGRKI